MCLVAAARRTIFVRQVAKNNWQDMWHCDKWAKNLINSFRKIKAFWELPNTNFTDRTNFQVC